MNPCILTRNNFETLLQALFSKTRRECMGLVISINQRQIVIGIACSSHDLIMSGNSAIVKLAGSISET